MYIPLTQKAVLACTLALLTPLMATAVPADHLAEHALTGKVTTRATPLAQARVYAYQMNDLTLRRVDTDLIGSFLFEQLPAGLYKIIAVKAGFVPAVVLLQRQTAAAAQYLSVDLAPQGVTAVRGRESFWSLREKIPADVLRDLETLEMDESDGVVSGSGLNLAETRFQAMTGADDGYVARISADGGDLVWASYFGSTGSFTLNDCVLVAGDSVDLSERPSSMSRETTGHPVLIRAAKATTRTSCPSA